MRRLAQMTSPTGHGSRRCFPYHELVERLPTFVRDKFDNGRVINEAEKGSLVRDQIEWVDQIVETGNDPRQCISKSADIHRDGTRGPVAASPEYTPSFP